MNPRLALPLLFALPFCVPASAGAADAGLPLPAAPVRVLIPDAAAFDAALGGAYRRAFNGEASEDDPLVAAWRQSQVGGKLEAQWQSLSEDLPWTWGEIRALKPTSLGLSLLDVGHLEAVLVIETPLAVLPAPLPAGTAKTRGSVAYHVVAAGAADASEDPDRRMGLAWAKSGSRLFLATSERSLLLALDAASTGQLFAPPLAGIVSLELDLDALSRDRYFRREFVFGPVSGQGRVRAALRLENGRLVEVREGTGGAPASGVVFDAAGAAAAGWDSDGEGFFAALRSGVLEPLPVLAAKPVPSLLALPAAHAASDDRYLVNLEKPKPEAGAPPAEEGELALWRELLSAQPVAGWGYVVGRDGGRRLVFAWPKSRENDLVALCRATVERRAGRASVVDVGDVREIRVGPDLPALALRRTGELLWISTSAADLANVPSPKPAADVVRWATIDLDAVRAEGQRWTRVEGPASPERIRPFSDRVLGLLGWMPETRSLSVERRKTANGWTERVVFTRSAE
jgi:hypothetical protein